MVIYRVHKSSQSGGSEGFEYFTSERKAKLWLKDAILAGYDTSEMTLHHVDKSNAGILAALNQLASHPQKNIDKKVKVIELLNSIVDRDILLEQYARKLKNSSVFYYKKIKVLNES